MTTIDRGRLRRLADAATPGPWVMDDDSRGLVGPWIDGVSEEGTAREIADCTWTDGTDAEFIAASREAVPELLDALTRAEAQSEARRQQTKYWKERAEVFEAKMNELDRAYISEHGQRSRAEDEQDRLKDKLARRSETVSRLLEERNNAEARIQAVRDLHRRSTIYDHVDGCPDTSDAHADSYHEEDMDHRDEYYCTLSPVQDVCFECSDEASGDIAAWPCPTIRALDDNQ